MKEKEKYQLKSAQNVCGEISMNEGRGANSRMGSKQNLGKKRLRREFEEMTDQKPSYD